MKLILGSLKHLIDCNIDEAIKRGRTVANLELSQSEYDELLKEVIATDAAAGRRPLTHYRKVPIRIVE